MTATDTPRLNAREVAGKLQTPVNAYLLARTYAECERERVDAIARKVLASREFYGSADHGNGRIIEPSEAWHMTEGDFATYHATMNGIHLDNGFADAARGYCPALVAEELQRLAERTLIECAEEFFAGVTLDKLFCNGDGLKTYKRYIDLLVGLVVNAPGYRSPLKAR